jgi:glutathione S-transferase
MNRLVWGIGTPRTLRPLWALNELGLEFEQKKFLPRGPGMDDPEFCALSSRHKIPFFQDDDVCIGESAAIITYLADKYGNDVLSMPAPESHDRAVLMDRAFYIMTEMDARMYTIRLHDQPPGGLSEIYGASQVAVETAKKYAERSFNESVNWFKHSQEFLMGDDFSIVDILFISCLDWAVMYNWELPQVLLQYRNRISLRNAYIKANEQNKPE